MRRSLHFSLTKKTRIYLGVLVVSLVSIVLFFGFFSLVVDGLRPLPPMTLGATFSASYATSLGLDWRETYTAFLDDLGVRMIRLPAYWNEVESEEGVYRFDDLDWIVHEAAKRNAKIVLAVGHRLPRWPECHAPAWANELPTAERQSRVLALVRTTVTRYRINPTIVAWQVENEPLLEAFGVCPKPDIEFLKQEVALVRSLDRRPIVVTESGELSTWLRTVRISDILGISMYRVSWNPYLGYIFYPLSPGFYRHRANAVSGFTKKIVVTELQAEPWVPQGILNTPLDEQFRSMNAARLRENIAFVRRAGFNEVYLWGVEWWYWLKTKKDDPVIWELGRRLYEESAPPPPAY